MAVVGVDFILGVWICVDDVDGINSVKRNPLPHGH